MVCSVFLFAERAAVRRPFCVSSAGKQDSIFARGCEGNEQLYLRRLSVAPQATKICILPLVNQFIATIKNTSILSAITLTELTREGTLIAYNSFHYFEPYIAVAVLYLVLTTIFTQLAGVLERRMA